VPFTMTSSGDGVDTGWFSHLDRARVDQRAARVDVGMLAGDVQRSVAALTKRLWAPRPSFNVP